MVDEEERPPSPPPPLLSMPRLPQGGGGKEREASPNAAAQAGRSHHEGGGQSRWGDGRRLFDPRRGEREGKRPRRYRTSLPPSRGPSCGPSCAAPSTSGSSKKHAPDAPPSLLRGASDAKVAIGLRDHGRGPGGVRGKQTAGMRGVSRLHADLKTQFRLPLSLPHGYILPLPCKHACEREGQTASARGVA